ncbi:MAG TPA: LemA family protein [Candidatus Polarisedimenticolaceae bacterium]|nr:LemA family protein [Candidatus Polarisedimenticolaceae bacterium]
MELWIVVGVVAVLVIAAIVVYNGLIGSKNRTDESWSDINVQLKRRYDLIPNLVNSVKGYATHESKVFQDVTTARSAAMGATTVHDKAKAENMLAETLKSLFAVSEAYPDLKASQNFQQLSGELVDTEDKIQAARRFYNGNVRDFNTKLQVFPTNLVAGMMGFKAREFFEADNQADIEKPVDVQF